MPEFEELRLVVSLTDHASAGLNNFQRSIQQFSSGQTANQIEGFKKQNSLMREALKATGLEATGTAKAFEGLSSKMLGSAGAISAVGFVLYESLNKVNAAAKEIRDQAISLERLGVSFAQGKNIIEQYRRFGIEEVEAQKNIGAAVNAQIQARKQTQSQMFDDLRKLVHGDKFVDEYRAALQNAKDVREAINVSAEYEQRLGELIEKNAQGKTRSQVEEEKASKQAHFREIQGFDESFSLAKQVTELDKDREAALERMNARAKEFRDLWNETAVNMEKIKDIFSDVAIKAFLPMMQNVKQTVDAIFQLFEQGHSALGDKNFWRNLIDPALVDWLDENVGSIKTLPQDRS